MNKNEHHELLPVRSQWLQLQHRQQYKDGRTDRTVIKSLGNPLNTTKELQTLPHKNVIFPIQKKMYLLNFSFKKYIFKG